MRKTLKALASTATQSAKKAATLVGDLNGDGKVDEADLQIAVARGKKVVGEIVEEGARLARVAARSDLAKDVAAGAAVGAVIAVPAPVVGPMAGAAVGAGFGLYKNVRRPAAPASSEAKAAPRPDFHAELLKLDDLRQKGILTEEEFTAEKTKLRRET